jgi:hypothetical protein
MIASKLQQQVRQGRGKLVANVGEIGRLKLASKDILKNLLRPCRIATNCHGKQPNTL